MKNLKTILLIVFFAILLILTIFIDDNNNSKNYEVATKDKIDAFNTTDQANEINRYSLKNIELSELAKLYYNDYKTMIVNYPDEAYEILINKNITKDEFLNFREKIINNYYNYNYVKYSSYQDQENDCYVYRVIDSQNKIFTFKVYKSMQYKVDIVL